MSGFYLRKDLQTTGVGNAQQLLDWAERVAERAAKADIYRSKEGRVTLRFEVEERSYFLKLHRGIGWREVLKNTVQMRLPILGADNEYHAINALRNRNVDTLSVAGFASAGSNPARRHSAIVTDDLAGSISLEDYCADWKETPPAFPIRLRLVQKVADTARQMHGAGVNHRDFYICHFHLYPESLSEAKLRCHLIDLHRAQIRRAVPRRWRVKDLAGLYFSAMDCGLTERDLLRFIRCYSDGDLRGALVEHAGLWRTVARVANALYKKVHGFRPGDVAGLRDG